MGAYLAYKPSQRHTVDNLTLFSKKNFFRVLLAFLISKINQLIQQKKIVVVFQKIDSAACVF